ncbi:MAG TPA: BLUF domain-containing protein [Humisphaera sp.]
MPGRLHRIVYVSDAVRPFSAADVAALGRRSAAANARRGVTGLLLYSGGHFVQLLEGNPLDVAELFDTVAFDLRHRDVHALVSEPAAARLFPSWWMGALSLDAAGTELDRRRLRDVAAAARRPDGRGAGAAAVALLEEFRRQLPAAAVA